MPEGVWIFKWKASIKAGNTNLDFSMLWRCLFGNLTPLLIITGACGIGAGSEYASVQGCTLQ